MRIGKYDFDKFGAWCVCEDGRAYPVHPMVVAVLDHIEVLQAKFANDLKLIEADRQALKARAEKAEAERDELLKQRADLIKCVNDSGAQVEALRANAEHAAKLLTERDELTAEVDELRGIVATFRRMAGDNADTRARFERETAADLMRRIVNVDVRKDGSYGFEYARASKCVADARDLADVVFAPAPPQFKVGDPIIHCSGLRGKIVAIHEDATHRATITWSDGTTTAWKPLADLRPAPPVEPWTPKKGDEVKIVATSTLTPNSASLALIGTHGKVRETYVDFRGKVARVGEYWFTCSDLELVCRAEDAAS